MNYIFSIGFAVIAFVISFSLGFIAANKMHGTKMYDYFASPCGNNLELDWGGRQFFRLFSKGMSERWYEARAHLNRGVFISLLATFHLIHIVRIEFETSKENLHSYDTMFVHGFQSLKTLKEKLPKLIEQARTKAKDAQYYYQTFISGHNIIHDFMNGELA